MMQIFIEYDWTFIFRLFYSCELLLCAILVAYVRSKFEHQKIRNNLLSLVVWLCVLATARAFGAICDHFIEINSGVVSLLINNIAWFLVVAFLINISLKMRRSKIMKEVVKRAENLFDDFAATLARNIEKTDQISNILDKYEKQ